MRTFTMLLLLLGAIALGGCANGPHSRHRIEPFSNGDNKVALNAEDVIHTMRRAGFTDEQIIELGPTLRNALAVEGGARVRAGSLTLAMFMADNGELYGVSLDNGSFRYIPASALRSEDEPAGQNVSTSSSSSP